MYPKTLNRPNIETTKSDCTSILNIKKSKILVVNTKYFDKVVFNKLQFYWLY